MHWQDRQAKQVHKSGQRNHKALRRISFETKHRSSNVRQTDILAFSSRKTPNAAKQQI